MVTLIIKKIHCFSNNDLGGEVKYKMIMDFNRTTY